MLDCFFHSLIILLTVPDPILLSARYSRTYLKEIESSKGLEIGKYLQNNFISLFRFLLVSTMMSKGVFFLVLAILFVSLIIFIVRTIR